MCLNRRDRIFGCLFGGAVGDALGYTVEFELLSQIKKKYGNDGITELFLHDGKAIVSDDTQMTLFTAAGLIKAMEEGRERSNILTTIWEAYKDWYHTQTADRFGYTESTFLYKRPELHARRAPGNTCLESLRKSRYGGNLDVPINKSKGCGGVMRVAPIGFVDFGNDKYQNGLIGAKSAALTHGHPLGYIPAFYLASLIHMIMKEDQKLELLIDRAIKMTEAIFHDNPYIKGFHSIMKRAINYAKEKEPNVIAEKGLGEGWTGDEAVAIATCIALMFQNDFKQAMVCAVNHDGDSDSAASITGNILGAYLGLESVEKAFKIQLLDLYDGIYEVANRLSNI